VEKRFIVMVAGIAASSTLAGCSTTAPAAQPPGALPAGTAEVSINGADAGQTTQVSCSSAGTVTTITTGDDDSGTISAVDTSDGLRVQFAQVRNVDGFTGSYWDQLGPAAEAKMTGRTFQLSGTANGFEDNNASFRTSGTFSIRVAC